MHIKLFRVSLGDSRINIPVADIVGLRPGKTLLVTGGMDGDEYAGIEAAYKLIEKYQDRSFAGRLIVIPIVNIPGFDNESSQNPLDQKFPKQIFPGNAKSSSTERLVSWLTTNYVSKADVWHDLHAGAITEGLRPFVWLHETGVTSVDEFTRELLASLDAEKIVLQPVSGSSRTGKIAKQNCVYILAESGERGKRDETSIDRHVGWVETTMCTLEMIDSTQTRPTTKPTVYNKVSYEFAPTHGLWRPISSAPTSITRGDVLGVYAKLDGGGRRELRATRSGTPLWWKETMRMKKNDILMAVGLTK